MNILSIRFVRKGINIKGKFLIVIKLMYKQMSSVKVQGRQAEFFPCETGTK